MAYTPAPPGAVVVRGEGPKNATVMLIGEAPGATEEKYGRPFVGISGRELNRFLQAAGLRRRDCYVTNMVKVRPPANRDPLPEEIACWAPTLSSELRRIQPVIIGALGRFASRWATGIEDFEMETWHGLPQIRQFGEVPHDIIVVPLYHPAAGLHNPALLGHIAWDIEQLGRVVRGEIVVQPRPTIPARYDSARTPLLPSLPYVALDTEGTALDPWGLSYTQREGEGHVLRFTDSTDWFRDELDRYLASGGTVLMHNAPWDIGVLDAVGITIPATRIIDTMVVAYLLRLEPQGLKQLARRHCGMSMRTYAETMRVARERLASTYFHRIMSEHPCPSCLGCGEALEELKTKMKIVRCPDCQGDTTGWPTPDPVLEWDSEDGVKLRQPQRLGKRVAKLLEVGTGLADAWQTMDEEVRWIAESVLGPMPEPTMDDLPGREAVVYAARDADATLRVWNQLAPRLASEGLEEAFELDRGILPIVSAMMGTGMGVDMDKLAALDTDLGRMMDEAEAVLSYTTGFDCNPGSGDQVADLLYRRLGAPPLGKPTTSGRPSTANKALESIRMACQRNDRITGAIDLILTYRHAAKLRGTYARPLRRKARWSKEWGSWRVYTKINTTRTDTGRLSSADPNLQNIPARSDLGKRVREAFVASPGMRLGAWDYDQIEMRVLAAESQDENLCRVFAEGIDIHAMTASRCFKVPIELVGKEQRRAAKTVGFGVVYGMSAKGLQEQLATMGIYWPESQCQELIDLYLDEAYPGVGVYMRERYAEALRTGAVRDMFGRRRVLAGVGSSDNRVHAEALRQAGNMPIQSAAAGVLKRAMLRVWDEALPALQKLGVRIAPLMQIHDELVFEFSEGAEHLVGAHIADAMEWEWKGVAFTVSGAWGANWAECK